MRNCDIPGTSAYEMHVAGVLCPACEHEEREAEWDALPPAERIAIRWDSARSRFARKVQLLGGHQPDEPPF